MGREASILSVLFEEEVEDRSPVVAGGEEAEPNWLFREDRKALGGNSLGGRPGEESGGVVNFGSERAKFVLAAGSVEGNLVEREGRRKRALLAVEAAMGGTHVGVTVCTEGARDALARPVGGGGAAWRWWRWRGLRRSFAGKGAVPWALGPRDVGVKSVLGAELAVAEVARKMCDGFGWANVCNVVPGGLGMGSGRPSVGTGIASGMAS